MGVSPSCCVCVQLARQVPRVARPALPAAATGRCYTCLPEEIGGQTLRTSRFRRRVAPESVPFSPKPGPLPLGQLAGGGDGPFAELGRGGLPVQAWEHLDG